MTKYPWKNATCRGSYALGTACGKCEACDYERAHGHAWKGEPVPVASDSKLPTYYNFNRYAMADDLAMLGYKWATICGEKIFVAQLRSGERVLRIDEFLRLCTYLGKHPTDYIK